jgi:hypothetical protein
VRIFLVLLAACGATGSSHGHGKARDGAIVGLVRDTKSGDAVPMADVEVGGHTTKSDVRGRYDFEKLPPGHYTLHARFAGQPVTIRNIDVTAGMASYVDVNFTLGDVTPLTTDYGDAREGEIQTFEAKVPRIEGTVGDASTRARVPGAVVTAARGADDETLQTITDDDGRYRFDNVDLGTYAISAYYSIGGRAQIEVRRADVKVEAGHGVLVPLWIELARQ